MEKKKFLKKKKCLTWFLFSWEKKVLVGKKQNSEKKKIFVRTRRRSRWTVAKITSLSKLKRGKRLRNADIFFRTAELISSSFIIFLHRLMFTPVLTLQVVAALDSFLSVDALLRLFVRYMCSEQQNLVSQNMFLCTSLFSKTGTHL